jgi:hypothetical protein
MTGALQWTTCQWYNLQKDDGDWTKVLAHKFRGLGTYSTVFRYGTHTPSTWHWRNDLQLAIVCSPESGLIAIDVDDPELFEASQTGQLVTRADACTVRDDHFHILLDARHIDRDLWPRQGRVGIGADAWGDIKSNGFVAAPGCVHGATGHLYEPTGNSAVLATPELIEALKADRASYTPPASHGGKGSQGGQGGGHDCEMMTAVMGWILDGCDEEECYERWLGKARNEEDPARPFGDRDLARHWRSASRYAGEILAREKRDRQWCEAILKLGRVTR